MKHLSRITVTALAAIAALALTTAVALAATIPCRSAHEISRRMRPGYGVTVIDAPPWLHSPR